MPIQFSKSLVFKQYKQNGNNTYITNVYIKYFMMHLKFSPR